MSHAHFHAVSSSLPHRFGGTPEAYLPIHAWFDATKAHVGDNRHRMLLHHTLGLWFAERRFGVTIDNGAGRRVPVRTVGEQHLNEDYGALITVEQCFAGLVPDERYTANLDSDTVHGHSAHSARTFGGNAALYREVHALLESGYPHLPTVAHRGLLHHGFGIQLAEELLGDVVPGTDVPTRAVAAAHIARDLGYVPSAADMLSALPLEPWMSREAQALSRRPELQRGAGA